MLKLYQCKDLELELRKDIENSTKCYGKHKQRLPNNGKQDNFDYISIYKNLCKKCMR